MLAIAYRIYCLRKVQVEYIHHIIYNKSQSCQKAEGLQAVGPNDSSYSAASGVEPNQYHRADGGSGERNSVGGKYVMLQYQAHQIQSCGGSQHLREKEERSPRLIRVSSEALS